MWISNTSIKRPVFATMFVLSFVVLGLVALTRLGIDLFPSLDFPFVNITTVYPGASPEEAPRGCGRGHRGRQARRVAFE